MRKTNLWIPLLLVGLFVIAQPLESAALIVDVVGKDTTLTLNDNVVKNKGITVNPLGAATLKNPNQIVFPITGGNFNTNTSDAYIQEQGSGFRLDKSNTTLKVQNLVINTNTNQVTGDVSYGFTTVPNTTLFTITNSSQWVLTKDTATTMNTLFNTGDLSGQQFGTVQTDLRVPEPSVLLLLGMGLVGLAAYRRS